MNEKDFANRLSSLRIKKGVSARDMSLSIGQNPGYINNIENLKSTPSLSSFFFICEYLGITPAEFFDFDNSSPEVLRALNTDLKKLNQEQLDGIATIVRGLIK